MPYKGLNGLAIYNILTVHEKGLEKLETEHKRNKYRRRDRSRWKRFNNKSEGKEEEKEEKEGENEEEEEDLHLTAVISSISPGTM